MDVALKSNHLDLNEAVRIAGGENGCGIITLPPGVFRILGTIKINPVKPVKFIGAGAGRTIINDLRKDGTTAILVETPGCYFSDFTLMGNESQRYGIDISNVYGKGTILERVVIGDPNGHSSRLGFGNEKNDGAGLCLTTSRYVRIRDCVIGDNYHGLKLTGTESQQPNVCSIFSSDIEHNAFSGIFCDDVSEAPIMFGGTLQYNGRYGVYSIVKNQQIKLHDVHIEANGFYLENGYNAILHFANTPYFGDNTPTFIVKNVTDVSLQGVRNNYAQSDFVGVERVYIDANCKNVRYEGQETADNQNLITNGDFESGSTGWSSARVKTAIEDLGTTHGGKSIKIQCDDIKGVGTSSIFQPIPDYKKYAGKQITVSAWVRAEPENINDSYIQLWSKTGVMRQLQVPKDGEWHFLSVCHTVDENPSNLYLYFMVKSVSVINTTDVLHVGDVTVNLGKNYPLKFPVRHS